MPTYEYECDKCHKAFELVQSMNDAPVSTCPKDVCRQQKWGKGKVRRMVGTGAGLIFKGSGFYITDYRSESYKAGEKRDSAGGEPKSEPKPAESKPAESKTAESKTAESKTGERKTPESKTPESKPPTSKPAETKPAEKRKSSSKKE